MKDFINKRFKIKERNSTIATEIIGGITTFLTMSYIVFVNPATLAQTGMDQGALITTTILATAIGTLIFALFANAPFALAPGMGLNAFFTYSLVLGQGITWQQGLGVVFISGMIFLILAIIGIRQKIADAIPSVLTNSSAVGIGLFLAFIGLQNSGLIVDNGATLVGLGEFTPEVLLALVSLTLMIIFFSLNIKGGIIISIALTTIIAMIFGYVELPTSLISLPPSIAPIAFKLDILGALKISLVGAIFSFLFIDLFDSLSFLIACSKQIGLEDENGNIENLDKMMYSDSTATIIGSLLGTSTITSFGESAAGISAGAKTGFSSVIISLLFLSLLIFTPIIAIVPGYIVAPALIIVGMYMLSSAKNLNFEDPKEVIPAFLTIILMPLTYSISIGLSFGFISYILLKLVDKKWKELSPVVYIIGLLCILNLVVS